MARTPKNIKWRTGKYLINGPESLEIHYGREISASIQWINKNSFVRETNINVKTKMIKFLDENV